MFNRATLVTALALAVAAAAAPAAASDRLWTGAGEAGDTRLERVEPSQALRFEVRGDVDDARAAGTWPVREYDPVPIYHRAKVKHRKQYPNVMGVRFADWLAAHDAASSARLASDGE